MSVCDKHRERLTAYLDGELGEDERRDLEQHLAGCADCQETRDSLQRTMQSLADTFRATIASAPPPPSSVTLTRTRRVWPGRVLVLLAAAAVVVLAVWFAGLDRGDEAAVQRARSVVAGWLAAGTRDLWMLGDGGRGLRVRLASTGQYVAQRAATPAEDFRADRLTVGFDGETQWAYLPDQETVLVHSVDPSHAPWLQIEWSMLEKAEGDEEGPSLAGHLSVFRWLTSAWMRDFADGRYRARLTGSPNGPTQKFEVRNVPPRSGPVEWRTTTLELTRTPEGDRLSWLEMDLIDVPGRHVGIQWVGDASDDPTMYGFRRYAPDTVAVLQHRRRLSPEILEQLQSLGYVSSDE